MSWSIGHKTVVHAGRKIKTYIWRHNTKDLMIVVSKAWLGKPLYKQGWIVQLKSKRTLKIAKSFDHFKLSTALKNVKSLKKKYN